MASISPKQYFLHAAAFADADCVPYTYFIAWPELGKCYYGMRNADGVRPEDFFVSYFTSSAHVKRLMKQHGWPSVREIRRVFTDKTECLNWEIDVLHRLDARNNPAMLNRHNGGEKFTTHGRTGWVSALYVQEQEDIAVRNDSEDFISGVCVGSTTKYVTALTEAGEQIEVLSRDTRFTTGELTHVPTPYRTPEEKAQEYKMTHIHGKTGNTAVLYVQTQIATVLPCDHPDLLSRVCIGATVTKAKIKAVEKATGLTVYVSAYDPRFVTNELEYIPLPYTLVEKDYSGATCAVFYVQEQRELRAPINHPDILSGECIRFTSNKKYVRATDANGNALGHTPLRDERFLTGELIFVREPAAEMKEEKAGSTGKANYRYPATQVVTQLPVDHPDVVAGICVSARLGDVEAKNFAGEVSTVSAKDPRFLTGEIEFIVITKAEREEKAKIKKPYKALGKISAFYVQEQIGRQVPVECDDRVLGICVHNVVKYVQAKFPDGKIRKTLARDERFKTGELEHIPTRWCDQKDPARSLALYNALMEKKAREQLSAADGVI